MTEQVKRFTKSAMLTHLQARIDAICAEYGFTVGDGWCVVENEPRIEAVIAFGAMDELRNLIEDIDWGLGRVTNHQSAGEASAAVSAADGPQ